MTDKYMEKLLMVYVTASDRKEAEKIAKKTVSLRLAACANVYDGMNSFYMWDGKMQSDNEAVIILKTKESLLPELKKKVKELHSYSCPCFLAIPVVYADEEYAAWMNDQLAEE